MTEPRYSDMMRHCCRPSLTALQRTLLYSCACLCMIGRVHASDMAQPLAETEQNAPVQQTCQQIAQKLASVNFMECAQLRLQRSNGYTVSQRPIVFKEFPPVAQRAAKGRVLLLGGIHGDEYASVTILFKWMKILDEHHSGLFHWRVVPLVNPDGLLQQTSQRMNANGVDLNRNFPTPNWLEESSDYWINKTRRNPRRYPGPQPLSEPESRWLVQEIESFAPDVIISVHAPHGILDFDGPRQAPKRLGNLQLHVLGTYPGSLGNYAGVVRQIPVVTIELPSAGIMPPPEEISRIWRDLVSWLVKHSSQLPSTVQAIPATPTDPSAATQPITDARPDLAQTEPS